MTSCGAHTGPYCTGGYVVRGTDGAFILTDGHCTTQNHAVWGSDEVFGFLAYTQWPAHDTALIQMNFDVTAYQRVVDPLTGRSPGNVVGLYGEPFLQKGVRLGKMGQTTGWQEGTIDGNVVENYLGMRAICFSAPTLGGDSGGPVWQSDGAGHVLAVGITVLRAEDGKSGCFIPIQRLLNAWGAWLPVFPSNSAARAQAPAMPVPPAAPLPKLDPKDFIPA